MHVRFLFWSMYPDILNWTCSLVIVHFQFLSTMNGQMYASSPTWYCGNAIDSDERGIMYFVGNSSLYLLDFASTPPSYILNVQVCRTRATCVSVCKLPGPWSCVTAGDGRVRLWDLESKQSTIEHSAHKVIQRISACYYTTSFRK